MKRLNKTISFLTLTFLTSYAAAGLFYLLGGEYDRTEGIIFAVCYMFIPLTSVLIVEKVLGKNPIMHRLRISFSLNRWFVVGWLLPPLVAFMAMGISLLFAEVTFSPSMEGMFDRFGDVLTPEQERKMRESLETFPVHPIWMGLLSGLLAGTTINAIAAFGEELGWRAFLVDAFRDMGFYQASMVIGFIWGIWHAPLVLMGHNYPDHPLTGVAMMTMFCILLSPLFLYVTLKARSVIAASIMHGTLNGTAGLSIFVIKGGNDLTVGVTGVAGFLALALTIIAFVIYDRVSGERLMNKMVAEAMRNGAA